MLLVLVAAWMARQHHRIALFGQALAPALEVLGAIPKTMGDHHQAAWGAAAGLHHHQLQRFRPVRHRQRCAAHCYVGAGHGGHGRRRLSRIGHQLIGAAAVAQHARQHNLRLRQVEPHPFTRNRLHQLQQRWLTIG